MMGDELIVKAEIVRADNGRGGIVGADNYPPLRFRPYYDYVPEMGYCCTILTTAVSPFTCMWAKYIPFANPRLCVSMRWVCLPAFCCPW